MFKKIFAKIPIAKYLYVAPIQIPNATLQAGIFHQNMGEVTPLNFLVNRNNIQHNDTVDTTYKNETGRGTIYVPNTKDFYIGEGVE